MSPLEKCREVSTRDEQHSSDVSITFLVRHPWKQPLQWRFPESGFTGEHNRTIAVRELGRTGKQRPFQGLVRERIDLPFSYMRGSGDPTGSSEAGMDFHRSPKLKLGDLAFSPVQA